MNHTKKMLLINDCRAESPRDTFFLVTVKNYHLVINYTFLN